MRAERELIKEGIVPGEKRVVDEPRMIATFRHLMASFGIPANA